MTPADVRPLRACLSLLLVAALWTAPPAAAWNAGGHRLTAAIAWRGLDEGTRAAVAATLARHPDYETWVKRGRQEDPGYAAFLEASTWPDDIKGDRRFHDDAEAPTPALKGFPDMARHRNWHHVDQPVNGVAVSHTGNGELDGRLEALRVLIAHPRATAEARAWALPWLVHLVGDAHQPLHTVSRYDGAGRSDEGGNELWIDNPFHPRRTSMSLHAYWDDLPGPPWLRGARLEETAGRMLAEAGGVATLESTATWIRESRQLARDVAYADLEGEVPTLTAAYHERAQKNARQRVTLAGQRLALLLRQLFAKP